MKNINAKLYHLTSVENISSVLKAGINSDGSGFIYLFKEGIILFNNIENSISDLIANNQLFLKDYALFEIKPRGIISEIQIDDVAEITKQFQFRVNQKKIHSRYIRFKGIFKTTINNYIN